MNPRHSLFFGPDLFCWLLIVVLLNGCAGYRLGPSNGLSAGARSIGVMPFENETFQPRLSTDLAQALRDHLQQDGTYELDTSGSPDILLTGRIVDFQRRPISFNPRDVRTVQDYGLKLVTRVEARERMTGRLLLDREVEGYLPIRTGTDLASAERQASPQLADDLARKITSLLVDGTW